jgi:hypothetical protein
MIAGLRSIKMQVLLTGRTSEDLFAQSQELQDRSVTISLLYRELNYAPQRNSQQERNAGYTGF